MADAPSEPDAATFLIFDGRQYYILRRSFLVVETHLGKEVADAPRLAIVALDVSCKTNGAISFPTSTSSLQICYRSLSVPPLPPGEAGVRVLYSRRGHMWFLDGQKLT